MLDILVTGGAGYIGSVLVPLLLSKGCKVTVLDNLFYNQSPLLDCCVNPNFTMINADARNENAVREAMKGKDYIIPLAALAGFPICDKEACSAYSINLDAIKMILRLRENGQRIIFPCTNSGYGLGEGEKFCTENSPIKPISIYGKSKVEAEAAVLAESGTTAFRFATLFGASPRMRTDLLVNDFVYRAVFDRTLVVFEGSFKRNYLHVRDAANAFWFAIENFEKMEGGTHNCGLSDSNLSKIELCEKIKAILPKFIYIEAPIGEDPDKRNYIVSNDKLESLGWKPEYSLDDGIKELVKAYQIIKNNQFSNI